MLVESVEQTRPAVAQQVEAYVVCLVVRPVDVDDAGYLSTLLEESHHVK